MQHAGEKSVLNDFILTETTNRAVSSDCDYDSVNRPSEVRSELSPSPKASLITQN